MQTRVFNTIQERIYEETLPNGLVVQLVPKPDYAKTFAIFTTRYGSIDHHFQREGEPEHRVTDGIAHFLEHKLFEEEWGDIFNTFATQGASANAFTSHTRTAYLFSATDLIEKNLETLLDFVQRPHLTPENVEKEKGIIEQEIRMYDDMPFWRAYRHMLENLFSESPVRIDIAGTVESIRRIDRDALMACYETFYHPSNMRLCVVGSFEAEPIMQLIRNNQARKSFPPIRPIRRFLPQEPVAVARRSHTVRLAVTRPLMMLGWKDKAPVPESERLNRELLMGLIQDLVFGRSSLLQQKLLDEGLVDDALSYDYEAGDGYGFSFVGVETDDPTALTDAVNETLECFIRDGIPQADFERAGHKQIGDYLYTLNSPEAIANHVTEAGFLNADYFAVPDMLAALTRAEAEALLREHFDPAQLVVSTVLPTEENAA
ncbi:MAG: pitrilysin family protein [Candidatus Sericytochromatia bacterium]|nr:pitrilysin family protein [Candidatus Sericytochromatia bacterium]